MGYGAQLLVATLVGDALRRAGNLCEVLLRPDVDQRSLEDASNALRATLAELSLTVGRLDIPLASSASDNEPEPELPF